MLQNKAATLITYSLQAVSLFGIIFLLRLDILTPDNELDYKVIGMLAILAGGKTSIEIIKEISDIIVGTKK